jgi:UPF0042 nucleotide-binding protein
MPSKIISFGYKYGNNPIQNENSLVIDIRQDFKRNPFHKEEMKHLTGLDRACRDYMSAEPDFWNNFVTLYYKIKDFSGVVYLGCTGGHHRSVYVADLLGNTFNPIVPVEHRDINRS